MKQVPTFGSQPGDFQGFVIGGWETMSKGSVDFVADSGVENISDKKFLNDFIPNANANDLVIVLDIGEGLPSPISEAVRNAHLRKGVQVL